MTKNKDREQGDSPSRQFPAKALEANANVRRIILILLSLVLVMVFIAAGIGIWKLTHTPPI